MKKGIIQIAGLFVFIITIHLSFYHNDIIGQTSIPMFTLWIYALYYLIKSIAKGINREYDFLIIGLTITVLVIFPTLKWLWTYYNVFLHAIVIILGTWLIFQIIVKDSQMPILSSLIVFNIAMILTPSDKMFNYFQKNTDRTLWRELNWNDFKIYRDSTDEFDASIKSTISAKLNYAYNYPPAVIIGYMKPFESQKKHNSQTDGLLKHEQGHFDLTEIYKRKTQDTIRTLWGNFPSVIQAAVDQKKDELYKQQKLYDSLTNHNLNRGGQESWNEYFDEELRKR